MKRSDYCIQLKQREKNHRDTVREDGWRSIEWGQNMQSESKEKIPEERYRKLYKH
jgi:hypothetical protein